MLTVLSKQGPGLATASPVAKPNKRRAPSTATWSFAAAVGIAIVFLWLLPMGYAAGGFDPAAALARWVRIGVFLGSLASLALMLAAIGVAVTGQLMGVLWTTRNAYSLSRCQIVMWTLLVLAALAAVAVCRAHGLFSVSGSGGVISALDIWIPGELLAVMGISLTSAVAAPAILSVKAQSEDASAAQLDAAAQRTGPGLRAMGQIMVRSLNLEPLARDLFQSDEVAKAGTVDIGKVQQAFVTVVLWLGYLGMVLGLFWTGAWHAVDKVAASITTLPGMSENFVYLLGISHAGYLAYKATPAAPAAAPGSTPPQASTATPRPTPPAIQ